jgi:hypothetical protein
VVGFFFFFLFLFFFFFFGNYFIWDLYNAQGRYTYLGDPTGKTRMATSDDWDLRIS